MAPPKSTKYLSSVNDYENFEFRSPVNAWNPEPPHVADFDKIKCLEVGLSVGQIIHIPAYWWYSIRFSKDSSVSCFRYRTYMNNLAVAPHIFLYTLQMQNIKRETIKKRDIRELKKEDKNDKKDKNDKDDKEDKENIISL
jgi:hypothetical protein